MRLASVTECEAVHLSAEIRSPDHNHIRLIAKGQSHSKERLTQEHVVANYNKPGQTPLNKPLSRYPGGRIAAALDLANHAVESKRRA
jgi:hypothetical protein